MKETKNSGMRQKLESIIQAYEEIEAKMSDRPSSTTRRNT